MASPFHHHHHHHHRDHDEDGAGYPPPGTRPPFSDPPPPPPPSFHEPPPPPHAHHAFHEPPPPSYVTHHFNSSPRPPVPPFDHPLEPPPPPPPVHHSHRPHIPSILHHHTHGPDPRFPNKPTVKVYTKANPDYSLTIRDGKIVLAHSDPTDAAQHWFKDEKYATRVKDEEGFPCFALVNKATGEAMKHSLGATYPVQLIPYNPEVLDESILWTQSKDFGNGYRAVRMVNNIHLNVDAFHGDEFSGGVHDGTPIVLWKWKEGDNQLWKIVPYCGSAPGCGVRTEVERGRTPQICIRFWNLEADEVFPFDLHPNNEVFPFVHAGACSGGEKS